MLLAFQPTYVPQIQSGTKVHTIRRGSRWQPGQAIQFHQHGSPPDQAPFRPDATVISTQPLRIRNGHLFLDERRILGAELEKLAHRDGFPTAALLLLWFQEAYGPEFEGQLIHWTEARY